MAKFTIQLAEYLQEHMGEGESINNLNDILNKSKEVLFDGAPTQAIESVIDDEYVDPFILGFTSHFLFDEIGHQTLPAWKLALASKILDTGAFVNKTFENLDNQIWSEYKVTKTNGTTVNTGTVENTGNDSQGGTITDEHNLQSRATRDRNATSEDDGTISDDGEIKYLGDVHNDNERYFTVDTVGTPMVKTTSEEMDRPDDAVKSYTENVRSGGFETTNTQSGKIKDLTKDSGSTIMTEGDNPDDQIKAYSELEKTGMMKSSVDRFGTITDTATDNGTATMTEKDGTGDKAYTKRTPTGTRTNAQSHTGGMIHGFSDHAMDNTQTMSQTPQSGVNASDIMSNSVSQGVVGNGVTAPSSVATADQTGKKYLTTAAHNYQNDRAHSEYTVPVDSVNGDKVTNVESYQSFEDKNETHYNRVQEESFNNRTHTNVRSYAGDGGEHSTYTEENVVDYDVDVNHPLKEKQTTHYNRMQEQSFVDREHETERTFDDYVQDSDTTYNDLTDRQEHHFNKKSVSITEYPDGFKEHNDSYTHYANRKDERDNVRTLDTTNTVHDNSVETGSDTGDITHIYDRSDDHTNTEERNLTTEDDRDERNFNFSYEMFVKAEPYLSKVWSLYDDLFMQLLDDFYFY